MYKSWRVLNYILQELARRTCLTTVSTLSKNITINLSKAIHESSEIAECTDHLNSIKPKLQPPHDSCINHGNDRHLKNNKNNDNDKVTQNEGDFVDFSLSKALSPQRLKCTSSVNKNKKVSPIDVRLKDGLVTFKRKVDESLNGHKLKYSLRNSKSCNNNILSQDSMKSETFREDVIPDHEKIETLLQANSKVFTPEFQITPVKLNQQEAVLQNISPLYNLVNVEKNTYEKSNKKTNSLRKYDFSPKSSPGSAGSSATKLNVFSLSTSATLPSDGVTQPKRAWKNNLKYNEASSGRINDNIDLEEDQKETGKCVHLKVLTFLRFVFCYIFYFYRISS